MCYWGRLDLQGKGARKSRREMRELAHWREEKARCEAGLDDLVKERLSGLSPVGRLYFLAEDNGFFFGKVCPLCNSFKRGWCEKYRAHGGGHVGYGMEMCIRGLEGMLIPREAPEFDTPCPPGSHDPDEQDWYEASAYDIPE